MAEVVNLNAEFVYDIPVFEDDQILLVRKPDLFREEHLMRGNIHPIQKPFIEYSLMCSMMVNQGQPPPARDSNKGVPKVDKGQRWSVIKTLAFRNKNISGVGKR